MDIMGSRRGAVLPRAISGLAARAANGAPLSNPDNVKERLAVLLVEDDAAVADAVRAGFAAARVDLVHAGTIGAAKRVLSRRRDLDAIVLDLNLPDGDGGEVVRACRDEGLDVPIIMITANDRVQDRIAGLSCGADDYICKPFSVAELVARLEAVLRRASPRRRHLLRYDDVELDLLHRRIRRGDLEAALSAREVDFLAYLMQHAEEVLPKERLLKEVWAEEGNPDDNVLHVYANYLRNKLEQGVYPRLIHTVRGVGYVFSRVEPDKLQMAAR